MVGPDNGQRVQVCSFPLETSTVSASRSRTQISNGYPAGHKVLIPLTGPSPSTRQQSREPIRAIAPSIQHRGTNKAGRLSSRHDYHVLLPDITSSDVFKQLRRGCPAESEGIPYASQLNLDQLASIASILYRRQALATLLPTWTICKLNSARF